MGKTRKNVTMADIAKEVDVSIVTVSKALSGQKGVSESLRQTILEKARQLGYEMSESGRNYTVGVVIAGRYLDDFDSFYFRMYQQVVEKAGKSRLFVIYESITEDMTREKILPNMVREQKVEGLILIGNPGSHYGGFLKENAGMPVVFLDFYDKTQGVDCIISDGFYGAYQLTNYLWDKGHREIGFVGTLLATESITDRYLGYVKALMEHGVKPKEELLIPDRDVETGLRSNYREFAFPKKLPTALVCNCDFIAGLVILALKEKGVRVPEDVSVVGYDNDRNPALGDMAITTYEVDMETMAQKAVKYLLSAMNGGVREPGIHIVKGKLVEKESAAAI